MNSPSAVKALSAAIAAPRVSVGRMIEQIGNRRRRKIVGSGMIRLVWVSSPSALRSGKTKPFVGSVRGGALPALSCQVWKCIISVPPMLSRIRNTSLSVTRWASDAYRLVPPCSIHAKWKPAVLAIACRWRGGGGGGGLGGDARELPPGRAAAGCGGGSQKN